jgi:hypothetical protein
MALANFAVPAARSLLNLRRLLLQASGEGPSFLLLLRNGRFKLLLCFATVTSSPQLCDARTLRINLLLVAEETHWSWLIPG